MHFIRMYDMKYKEKVTYRTTASGGQEIITEQVPVYNKFEQFAKKQHDKRMNKINGTKEGKPVKIPFILKHPGICALILGVFIILVAYLISSANTYMDELIKQYTSLTAKTNDSKYAFDKKLFYVTVEADGTKKITFGYKSEEQQKQAEEAADEAVSTGTTPTKDVSSSGPVTSIADANVSTDGRVISGITIGGKPVYDGIPAQWNASDNSKYIDFAETVKGWKEWYNSSFGHEYPNNVTVSGYHDDSYLNKYSTAGKNGKSLTYNGVECIGFAPSEYYGTLTFKQSDGSQLSSAYNYSYCIVLKSMATGDYVFMPAIATDAKAHTWPGSVCQTYTKFDGSRYLYCKTAENGDNTTDVDEMISILESGVAGAKFGSNKTNAVQMNLEVYKISSELNNSGFTAVGVIRVE